MRKPMYVRHEVLPPEPMLRPMPLMGAPRKKTVTDKQVAEALIQLVALTFKLAQRLAADGGPTGD